MVFNIGGGNFDVSVLDLEKGVIEVKAICGDTHLGGEDFDNTLVNFCIDLFSTRNGIDISKDPRARLRLR